MKITRTPNSPLHAQVEGVDLSRPLSAEEFSAIEKALGDCGVLSFPRQALSSLQFKTFSEQFGRLEVNVANRHHEPGFPEMMILSNIVRDGVPAGMADAGQGWHTDLSYTPMIAYATILYGVEIPHRDGKPLGSTSFCNMHAAYDELPANMKRDLKEMTVLHDFDKFWEMMRTEKGSKRPPLTKAQRDAKPPSSHPVFLTHPITGKKVLYANPGYAVRINELSSTESDRVLNYLFEHQTQPKYQYTHRWSVGDVLMWDDIGTIHNAVADYVPTEHRLLKRCQVSANRFFQ